MTRISFEPPAASPADNYERYFVPAIGAPLAHDLVELADLRPGEDVVDVACGTGIVTRLAAERVGGGALVGVDVNPGMLQAARDAAGDAAIEWHQASAEALPLGNETFDVALCQMGLQFFPDRQGALREMRRVLRSGGRLALNVPGPAPAPFAFLEEALQRHIGPEAGSFVATVFCLHDTDECRAHLEGAGFRDVQAHARRKVLTLPAPADFLWQYVYSTPLAEAASRLDADDRARLQQEVVAQWEPWAADGEMTVEVDVTSASGRQG